MDSSSPSISRRSLTSSIRSPSKPRTNLAPQDKGAVVLEIGHAYTRIGISGEPAPRHIIKSKVSMRPYGEVLSVWDSKYITRDELYLILCRFLSEVYLKYLMINPKDYRVVIVEPLMCPTHFRNTLAKALFRHFLVPYVCLFPLHLSCLFTLGKSTALIVDVGFKETTVLPIYKGVAIVSGWQVTSSGMESFHGRLLELLTEKGTVSDTKTGKTTPMEEYKETPLEDILPDIAVKTCFVRPLSRGDQVPLEVIYPLNPTHSLTISGYIRSHAADSFFADCLNDLFTQECILDSLLKCSIDCRKELAENIIVIGSGACLPGFNWRLKEELVKLLSDSKYKPLNSCTFKFHTPPSQPNCTAWQGGSIFGNFEMAVLERSVSREEFKQKACLPEWMSCDPQHWETIKNITARKVLAGGGLKRELPPTVSLTKPVTVLK